ncbi:hypothetical protein BFP70_15660 [Thioclava sp. SK-1]|nr:hypothetical protein BFP70_15660 [Thioclava sp. SK-1]
MEVFRRGPWGMNPAKRGKGRIRRAPYEADGKMLCHAVEEGVLRQKGQARPPSMQNAAPIGAAFFAVT